jgi:hypothetical protein
MLVLVPASAGASTIRPPVALTASPSHLGLDGSGRATVLVTNSGASRVVVDVSRAGFALDLRGRPRIVGVRSGPRSAATWVTFRPPRISLAPGAAAPVAVTSRLPPGAEPGDHDALVLFTTRRIAGNGVAVRMRMGVVVVVRAPGTVVRRLALRGLRATRAGRARMLELAVVNKGNVTESIERKRATVSLFLRGVRLARFTADPRDLRPGTRGIVQFRVRGDVRGRVTARVEIRLGASERVVRRSYRISL